MEKLTASIKETRHSLGNIGQTKVYELIADGKLKTLKLGRRTLVLTSSIRDLVDELSQ